MNMREMTHGHSYVCMRKSHVIDSRNRHHWKTTAYFGNLQTATIRSVACSCSLEDDSLQDSCICVLHLLQIHVCDMTHSQVWQPLRSYVWHDTFIWMARLFIHMCDGSFICVTRHIQCVTRIIHICDLTHSCVRHDSFIGVTWLMYMIVMTHLIDFRNWRHWKTICCCRFTPAWYPPFTWRGMSEVTRMNESRHMWKRVIWQIWIIFAYLLHMCTFICAQPYTYRICSSRVMWHIWISRVAWIRILCLWRIMRHVPPTRMGNTKMYSVVAHMNASCHTYECVTPHISTSTRRMRRVSTSRHTYGIYKDVLIRLNESCHTNGRVMSHTYRHMGLWVSKKAVFAHIHTHASCHTYGSNTDVLDYDQMHCHTYGRVMWQIFTTHARNIRVLQRCSHTEG